MKLLDTIKLIKYTNTPSLNVIAYVVILFTTLVTSFPLNNNNVLGAFWANYCVMIFISQIYNVACSGVIQSSEKYKKTVTKNVAVLIGIFNIFTFVVYILIRTTVAFAIGTEKNVATYIIAYMFFQFSSIILQAVVFKKFKLGIVLAIPMFILLLAYELPGKIFVFSGNLMILIVAAGITCIISPLVFYGIAMLLYKLPFGDRYLKRLERQTEI